MNIEDAHFLCRCQQQFMNAYDNQLLPLRPRAYFYICIAQMLKNLI